MQRRIDQLKALADPTRMRLVTLLHGRGETCVCELVDELGTTQGNISAHLRVLRSADLIRSEKIGKWVFYSLQVETVAELLGWLGQTLDPTTAVERPSEGLYACCQSGAIPLSVAAAGELTGGPGKLRERLRERLPQAEE